MLKYWIFSFLTCMSLPVQSQQVTSLVLDRPIKIDGMYIAGDTIHACEGWDGSRLFRIDPNGKVSTFCSGLKGPIDLIKRSNGKFYVSEWNASRVAIVSESGTIEAYISTLPGPGPLVANKQDDIFLTHNVNDGSGFISKIDLADEVSSLFSGEPLINPGGIDLDENQNFYVSNFNNGDIIKITSDLRSTIIGSVATSGFWKTGHLAFKNDQILISGLSSHNIYSADKSGNVVQYAGSGIAGHVDGPLKDALFSSPNGIELNKTKDILYIAQGFVATNYIQKINFGIVGTTAKLNKQNWNIRKLAPYKYEVSFNSTSPTSLMIQDAHGKVVFIKKNISTPYELANERQSGVYFISLISGNKASTKTLVEFQ